MTPRKFISRVQLIFVSKILSGDGASRMWLRRLENEVVEHLLTFILILHLLIQGCKILMASFSFLTANFMLPDRTVTVVSSAYIKTATLL
jgi:hypothetical protein